MNFTNLFHHHTSRSRALHPHTSRSRALPLLAVGALSAAALAASGCGSSSSSSTITVGNEKPPPATLTQATATSTAAATPTSGPLATKPVVSVPKGAAPKKLETKDLIVGTGAEAKAGQPVTVNYVGVLYKGGKEFDASWKRKEPFTFNLGQGQVIKGWDQGVAGMKVGGRRELIIPSELGYGAQGRPPSIPPSSALVFVVDLLAT
jgi:peptidylprolyl isomerase